MHGLTSPMKFHLAAFVVATILSSSAGASSLTSTDSELGVGSITRDAISGLDWLDLTFTANKGRGDVEEETAPGGLFEGFRIAEESEVGTLFEHAGITIAFYINDIGPGDPQYDSVAGLLDLVGALEAGNETRASFAVTNTWGTVGYRQSYLLTLSYSSLCCTRGAGALPWKESVPDSYISPNQGVWLVRNAPITVVPVPPALPLLASAIVVAGALRRRRI